MTSAATFPSPPSIEVSVLASLDGIAAADWDGSRAGADPFTTTASSRRSSAPARLFGWTETPQTTEADPLRR